MQQLAHLYDRYRQFKPFSDSEAWMLFKLAAFGEAVGWTLLISGILYERTSLPWHQYSVLLAGRVHGMLFLLYICAALLLAPSLRWSFFRSLLAGLCSVPPYGSLLYEQWEAHRRSHKAFNRLQLLVGYKLLCSSPGPPPSL